MQIQYIDTINVPFCILEQLLKLTATNLDTEMTSTYKILRTLKNIPDVFWIIS